MRALAKSLLDAYDDDSRAAILVEIAGHLSDKDRRALRAWLATRMKRDGENT